MARLNDHRREAGGFGSRACNRLISVRLDPQASV